MDTINSTSDTLAPIQDLECEKMVLATLMTSYHAMTEVDSILDPDCFYDLHNREIFEAIREVYKSGDTPDLVSVTSALAKRESTITGLAITELCVNTHINLDITPRAARLRDLGLRRKLWEIGMNLVRNSSLEAVPIETVHNDAKTGIDNLFDGIETRDETLADSYRQLQERMLLNRDLQPGQTLGTPTGFPAIDLNGGLNGSDLIIVGAETSQGKTSFATALTVQSIKHGDGVAFYSMEMMPWQLAARIASMESGVVSSKIMYRKMEIDEIYAVDAAMERVPMDRLYFDGRSTSSLDSITMSIRQMKMKYGIKGAVVDYLQLINVSELKFNREQGVAHAARELKNLAKELNIWIIAISQLRRENVSSVPTMSRLRDSGQIEEAADNIYLIYRPRDKSAYPEPFGDIPTEGTAEIIVGKGRNTGTTEFICGFKGENTLFYPLDDKQLEYLKTDRDCNRPWVDPLADEVPF